MNKYLDFHGLGLVADEIKKNLKIVTEIPSGVTDNSVVLYIGQPTSSYKFGHIYQHYSNDYFCYTVETESTVYLHVKEIEVGTDVYVNNSNPTVPASSVNDLLLFMDLSVTSVNGDGSLTFQQDESSFTGFPNHTYDLSDSGWTDITGAVNNASDTSYSNNLSGLTSTNVQGAIDELAPDKGAKAIANSALSLAENIRDVGLVNLELSKLTKTDTVPSTPSNGDVILYIGTNTASYLKGHIYQYDSSTTTWIDLSDLQAVKVIYNNTTSGLQSTNVQGAIDALRSSSNILYDNTTSHLQSVEVQSAIDELKTDIDAVVGGGLVPKGTIAFSQLPSLSNVSAGYMYNISDAFTTDNRFITPGIQEGASSNVYVIDIGNRDIWFDGTNYVDSTGTTVTILGTLTNSKLICKLMTVPSTGYGIIVTLDGTEFYYGDDPSYFPNCLLVDDFSDIEHITLITDTDKIADCETAYNNDEYQTLTYYLETDRKLYDVFANIDISGKIDANSIAPAFSTSSTYYVDYMCTYNGLLYRCIVNHVAGAWNASHFERITLNGYLQLVANNITSTVSVTPSKDMRYKVSTSGITLTLNKDTTTNCHRIEIIAKVACSIVYNNTSSTTLTENMAAGTVKILYSNGTDGYITGIYDALWN